MRNQEVKFYFYEMQGKINDIQEDLPKLITGVIWSDITPPPFTSKSGFVYEIQIENIKDNYYFGRIIRAKENDAFFAKDDGTKPRELTDTAKRIGERGRDIVNFAFVPRGNNIVFIMEVGFQTAGMGVVLGFFEQYFSSKSLKLDYKSLTTEKVKSLTPLIKQKLKKITIQFRKNADIPENCKQAEDILGKLADFEKYSVTFEASIKRKSEKTMEGLPILGDIYQKLFGTDFQSALDAGIDFPAFLSNFKIEVFDDAEQTVSEDVLERLEHVSISLNKDELDDSELKEQLCSALEEKINPELSEQHV